MPQFTPQQRAFLVTEYHRHKNIGTVLQRFREAFPRVRSPSRATVYNNVNKYNVSGSSCNLNRGRSGRRRTARTRHNIDAVRNALEHQQMHGENGHRISARRNGLGLPPATLNRITRLDLIFHPYQMIRRHQLLAGDYQRRLQFCEWLLAQNDRFLHDVVIGDESGFAMNASVNTHNIREYNPRGQQPLEFQYQRNDSRQKLTVWVGMMGNGSIIGPFFFRHKINGEDYLRMVNDHAAIRRMRRYRGRNEMFRRVWWLQDGAPPHRRRIVFEGLEELFQDRVIALNRQVEWPPRSPDLTPLDFFLWGYLKSKVYQTPPVSLDDLEERIRRELDILKQDRAMVRRAVGDMLRRARLCRDGGHVEE